MILPDGLAAVLLGWELRLPVVCTLHGSDVRVYPYRSRITRWFTRWSLRHAHALIAVSSELKSRVLSLSDVSKVSVIPNGADSDTFKPASQLQCRSELGLPQEKKIVLFVGNLKPVKGIEFLLRAICTLRRDDLHLCLVGDGESRTSLIALANQLGISNICHFVGARRHDEVSLWLGAADCLVLPSLSEGLPTILVEAMFCRTPVIATDVGGVPELVQHGHTGLLVKPRNTSALAQGIAEILDNQTLRSALVERAELRVRGRLTWEANARATMIEYQDVLRGGTRSGDAADRTYISASSD
jgi:glycosyltransferase involved in cell wall biosynthesis